MVRPLPPLPLLQGLFHYNPLTGSITYAQQRGPHAIGDPAGSTVDGRLRVYADGSYHDALSVAYALHHGQAPPAGLYVTPRDGNPSNTALANLQLSEAPFRRQGGMAPGTKRRRRPGDVGVYRQGSRWEAWTSTDAYEKRRIGVFDSKIEAQAARAAYLAGEPIPSRSHEKIAALKGQGISWVATGKGKAPRIMAEGVSPDDFPVSRRCFGAIGDGVIFWYKSRLDDLGHWYIKKGVHGAYTCDMSDNHYRAFKKGTRVYVPLTLERIFAGM